jgi:ubiquinol-cytochrome c reductase cytochrome b subunit
VFHFLLPWLSIILILAHLIFLHNTGSSSKIMCHVYVDKVNFYPYYWFKDLLNLLIFILFFGYIFWYPFILGDVEIFVEADPLNSPVHIIPEWYFLFAYAILRSIPNKILGILCLLLRIFVFMGFLLTNGCIIIMRNFNLFLIFNFIFVGVLLR